MTSLMGGMFVWFLLACGSSLEPEWTLVMDEDGDGYCPAPAEQDPSTLVRCDGELGWGDCDDGAVDVFPGATEHCNYRDDDCDGLTDEGREPAVLFEDRDGDRFGNPLVYVSTCEDPGQGWAYRPDDCNDEDPEIHPGSIEVCNGVDDDCDGDVDDEDSDIDAPGFFTGTQIWFFDADGDTFGDTTRAILRCVPPPGFVAELGDCDDDNESRHPDAEERCNGVDDDCDRAVDQGLPQYLYWPDADGDGHGAEDRPQVSRCESSPPPGLETSDDDCDDQDANRHPGRSDPCDGVDNDCDGRTDENGNLYLAYVDVDGDGYGRQGSPGLPWCGVPPEGFVGDDRDCDDDDFSKHPAAPELCNQDDDNCDGEADEGLGSEVLYGDGDGDGWGDEGVPWTGACQEYPEGYVERGGDCDDADPDVNPDEAELCDGIDQDCDDAIDEGHPRQFYWPDIDEDGFGDEGATSVRVCAPPAGHVGNGDDCNDADSRDFPGTTERCDGRDNNCDRNIDEGLARTLAWPDADGDRFGDENAVPIEVCSSLPSGLSTDSSDCDDGDPDVNPGADEQCNGLDDDCDGDGDVGCPRVNRFTARAWRGPGLLGMHDRDVGAGSCGGGDYADFLSIAYGVGGASGPAPFVPPGKLVLEWDVSEVAEVSIDGVGSGLSPVGYAAVNASASETFTLRATGSGGPVTAEVSIARTSRPYPLPSERSDCVAIPLSDGFKAVDQLGWMTYHNGGDSQPCADIDDFGDHWACTQCGPLDPAHGAAQLQAWSRRGSTSDPTFVFSRQSVFPGTGRGRHDYLERQHVIPADAEVWMSVDVEAGAGMNARLVVDFRDHPATDYCEPKVHGVESPFVLGGQGLQSIFWNFGSGRDAGIHHSAPNPPMGSSGYVRVIPILAVDTLASGSGETTFTRAVLWCCGDGCGSCNDVDCDGYGDGCAGGLDCNDGDAGIRPGASAEFDCDLRNGGSYSCVTQDAFPTCSR